MIKREDINDKTQEEIKNVLEQSINNFIVEVADIDDLEELKNRESQLIKDQDEFNEYLKTVNYTLPNDCTFDNQNFSKSTVAGYIVDFLNTQDVEWSYTLGLYEMVKLWKDKNLENISYGAYDSTLRILNQCRFKGFESWKKILIINNFMSSCHNEFIKDTSYLIYLSQLHNIIIDKLNPNPKDTTDDPREMMSENN